MKRHRPSDSPARGSRRQFTKDAATAILSAPALLAAARRTSAQTPPASKPQAPAPPNPQPTPAAPAQKPSPLAEAYTEVVRTRFGDQLKPDEYEQLKRDFDGYTRTSERLRAYKLKNSDEPDFTFRA